MRSDIALYLVAAFFFALTITAWVIVTEEGRSLWIVSTAVLGILSAGLGYYQRPHANIPTPQTKSIESASQAAPAQALNPSESVSVIEPTAEIEATQVTEVPIQPPTIAPTPPVIEAPTAPVAVKEPEPIPQVQAETASVEQIEESPLTKVKGIGEKRAAQLNALGINTVEDLAKASVDDVAQKLKVSSKIVAKWVEGAKNS